MICQIIMSVLMALISVHIYDKKPFDRKWYSFKSNRDFIRYEVGLRIATGFIAWFFGVYKAGKFNDLQLAKEQFTSMLLPGGKAVSDKVYSDARYFVNPLLYFKIEDRWKILWHVTRMLTSLLNCFNACVRCLDTGGNVTIYVSRLLLNSSKLNYWTASHLLLYVLHRRNMFALNL